MNVYNTFYNIKIYINSLLNYFFPQEQSLSWDNLNVAKEKLRSNLLSKNLSFLAFKVFLSSRWLLSYSEAY